MCLQYDPRNRPSIEDLLKHPYLTEQHKKSNAVSPPQREPHLKQMMHQLAQLTPNSLEKITSSVSIRLYLWIYPSSFQFLGADANGV